MQWGDPPVSEADPGHYVLDFVDHGRLTHVPSGKTLVRRGWMRGEQWAEALKGYAAANPGATEIRSLRGTRVGDLRDFPELGGSLAEGDRVLTTDREGCASSRLVLRPLPGEERVFELEDGTVVYWDDLGWSAPSLSDADERNRAVKIRTGDPDPGLDPGAVLLSVLRQARSLLEHDRDFHSLAGRIPEEERAPLGETYTALLVEADGIVGYLKPRLGLLRAEDETLDRGADLLRRLVEHVEACRDHPQASPSVGRSRWSGAGRLLMRATAVVRVLSERGHGAVAAPSP